MLTPTERAFYTEDADGEDAHDDGANAVKKHPSYSLTNTSAIEAGISFCQSLNKANIHFNRSHWIRHGWVGVYM